MPVAKKVHHVTAEQCLSEKCSVVICAPITSKPGKLLMYGLNHGFVNVPDGECIQICSKASDSHDILFSNTLWLDEAPTATSLQDPGR